MNFLRPFKILPPLFKLSWACFLISFVALIAATFTNTAWQGSVGVGCFLAGYIFWGLDFMRDKSSGVGARNDVAAGFHSGMAAATLTGLFVVVAGAIIAMIVLSISMLIGRSVSLPMMQLLSLCGMLYTYGILRTVPKFVIEIGDEAEAEEPLA